MVDGRINERISNFLFIWLLPQIAHSIFSRYYQIRLYFYKTQRNTARASECLVKNAIYATKKYDQGGKVPESFIRGLKPNCDVFFFFLFFFFFVFFFDKEIEDQITT